MKLIAILLLTTLTSAVYSQIYDDTAVFKDGTTIPFYLKSATKHPPKYCVSISPLTVMFLEADGYSALMGSAQTFVRINQKMAIDARVTLPYGRTGGMGNSPDQKPGFEFHAAYNYRIGQLIKEKKRRVPLMSKNSTNVRYDYDIYAVSFPAERVTNYYVTGGINLLRTAGVNYDLKYTDSSMSRYYIGNATSFSLAAGITRDRYLYYLFSSPQLKKKRSYYYRVRNYFLFTYAPMLNYTVFGRPTSESSITDIAVSSGYIVPTDIRRIGWRVGGEVKFGATGMHNGIYMGTEFGRVHGVRNPEGNFRYYGSLYFMLKVGYEFGAKTTLEELND